MKVLGYIMLHYGREYLEYVIKSIEPFCDKIVILYTPTPTHNHDSGMQCPENRSELLQIARDASNKVQWEDVNIFGEGNHRQMIFSHARGYDLVLNADSDEVWDQDALERCVKEASETDSRYIGVYGFVNFYRSFNWIVKDFFYPIRFHNMHSGKKEVKTINGLVYHFGYVQDQALMLYKISIHGHRAEFKNNWLVDKYVNFDPEVTEKMHPCSETVWLKAEKFDKTTLPEILKSHPYYNLEKI